MNKENYYDSLILVVEDDPDASEMIRDILLSAGYRVETSLTLDDGLSKAESMKPDLIVLDLMFPGPEVKGVDACRKLATCETTKTIPVVVVTARHELSVKLSSFMAGARRYVTKPFDVDTLVREVECAFRQAKLGNTHGPSAQEPRD